jgi:predicted HTH domain antitoxin
MNISISDDILKQAGLSETDARVEFACWLFDSGRLEKTPAARLCGLERPAFEAELAKRGLTVYRTTLEEYEQDRESLRNLTQRKAS